MTGAALRIPFFTGLVVLCLSGCGKPESPQTPGGKRPQQPTEVKKAESAEQAGRKPVAAPTAPPKEEAPPPVPIELPAAERAVLDQRAKGELKLRQVRQHAQDLTDRAARRDFLIEWFRLEDRLIAKEQEERVDRVQAGILEIGEQLKWPDAKLQTLAADRTPVEIRAALQAKLGAEKSRLRANQKMMRVLQLELNGVRSKFAAEMK